MRSRALFIGLLSSFLLSDGGSADDSSLGKEDCSKGWRSYAERKALELENRGALGFAFEVVVHEARDLPSPRLVVVAVAAGSPAQLSGLREGDIIVGLLNGRLPEGLRSNDRFHNEGVMDEFLSRIQPGQVVSIDVLRKKERSRVEATAKAAESREIRGWLTWYIYRNCGESAGVEYSQSVERAL